MKFYSSIKNIVIHIICNVFELESFSVLRCKHKDVLMNTCYMHKVCLSVKFQGLVKKSFKGYLLSFC
jgi:hypothetical protein